MKLIERLNEVRKQEEGVALVTALIVVFSLLMVVTFMSTSMVGMIQKQSSTVSTIGTTTTLESGLANAVALANNPLPSGNITNHIGPDKAVYGVSDASDTKTGDGLTKWAWYATPVSDAITDAGYDITVTAYNETPSEQGAKTVTTRLQSLPVTNARYLSDGDIGYTPVPSGNFAWGLLGANGVTLGKGVVVRSFDSAVKAQPVAADDTNIGGVASNAQVVLDLNTPSDVKRVVALQTGIDNSIEGRCVSEVNCAGKVVPYSFGIDTAGVTEKVNAACPGAPGTYPNWVASQRLGSYNPSIQGKCWNNVVFDINTEVSSGYNANTPAEMLISGNITVYPTVKVNQSVLRGGPAALRIYSSEGTLATFMGADILGSKTQVAAMIAGYKLQCVDNNTLPKSMVITGGLACNTINFKDGTTFWWDSAVLRTIKHTTATNVRGTIYYPINTK